MDNVEQTEATIRGIAVGETPDSLQDGLGGTWIGFDDADIYWFLMKYQEKGGPAFIRLRTAYREATHEIQESEGVSLSFFPIDEEFAAALVEEMDN